MYVYPYQPYAMQPMQPMYYPVRSSMSMAHAQIKGSKLAPDLKGYMTITDVQGGAEVSVEVSGLPKYQPAKGKKDPIGPHGFHIHDKGDCSAGDPSDPYKAAGSHWNPDDQPHGNHAGDFPVLFSNDGYARMSFFTNRFKAADVVGKSIIIHENPDDYRTQPAGDAGKRIACGVIQASRY